MSKYFSIQDNKPTFAPPKIKGSGNETKTKIATQNDKSSN